MNYRVTTVTFSGIRETAHVPGPTRHSGAKLSFCDAVIVADTRDGWTAAEDPRAEARAALSLRGWGKKQ